MKIREASAGDVAFVLQHLRPHCQRELFATRQAGDEPIDIGTEIDQYRPFIVGRFALVPDGYDYPAAILMVYRASPAVAMMQMFSTDLWALVARSIVPWFCSRVGPLLDRERFQMAECYVLETPDFDRRWFNLMGFDRRGDALPRGRNGERYLHMVRLNPTIYGRLPRVGSDVISLATRARL